MQVCISLQTDNHASTPPLSFLQAGGPSCRPANSVKALKAIQSASRCITPSVRSCVPQCGRRAGPSATVETRLLCGRFTVRHVLSEADADWPGLSGQLREEIFDQFVESSSVSSSTLLCVCGPMPFTHEFLRYRIPPPSYLCPFVRSGRGIRLPVPSVKLSTVGGRAFLVARPTIWNSLPDNVISAPSLSTFRQHLKTFLFQASFLDIITDPR